MLFRKNLVCHVLHLHHDVLGVKGVGADLQSVLGDAQEHLCDRYNVICFTLSISAGK